jgi:type III secretory pathway component EscS
VVQQTVGGAALEHLLVSFETYERDLNLLGLNDSQVVAEYSRRRLRLALMRSILKVVVALPFAAIGVVVHVLPFQVIKQVAKKPTNEGIKATVKLLGCFVSFVIVYVLVGFVVGRVYGPWAGFIAALAAPMCGYVAVRLIERVKRIGGVVEGYRTVKVRPDVLDSVRAHRQTVMMDARNVLVES